LVEALADCAIYMTVIRILGELERMVLRETQTVGIGRLNFDLSWMREMFCMSWLVA
jgi:hypothetical protein